MFVRLYNYFNAVLIFLLEQKGKRGEEDLGDLLLFNPLWLERTTAPAYIIMYILR